MVNFGNWTTQVVDDRVNDTQKAIDEDPTDVRVYRGRQSIAFATYRVRIITSNNIPNRLETSASQALTNDVNILAMPGTDLRSGDRVSAKGTTYVVRFVMPEQDWEIVAQAVTEAQGVLAP
jgi:hypothetical protein